MVAIVASDPRKIENAQEVTQCLSEDFHFFCWYSSGYC